ncbi:heavy-metal-associated domain-containing protein [Streptomyces cavernae]|uniref:heavy-metal-associated domain-containing protein n=1 Tax=Streptomyces cavernae TaxID=2259034 RepID=UPI000FEBA8E0|nr:heavy metal-associated domain-containing protein [Streptomyces cavernae]
MAEQRYHVIDMTCGRCAGSIETKVSGVLGVDRVGIDLSTRSVIVTGDALDGAKVCEAIADAGFEVAAVL